MLTQQQALQRLKADIKLRGMSESTFNAYLSHVSSFLNYCNRPIDELTELDVRKFLGHLITQKKLAPSSVNLYSSAIRFFFAVTLNRAMNYLQIPRVKVPKKLPQILTREEISKMVSNCTNLKHKALLLLAYGSGLRASELVSLRVKDIDSKTMRVFVCGGKGNKDRYTILSQSALIALRNYWRRYRPDREGYLFPAVRTSGHLTPSAFSLALYDAVINAGITKNVSPHTLRHCFATHLLENGYTIFQIKELLGHSSLQSTVIYLHMANTTSGVVSPVDIIFEGQQPW